MAEIGKFQLLAGKTVEAEGTFSLLKEIDPDSQNNVQTALSWAEAGNFPKALSMMQTLNRSQQKTFILRAIASKHIVQGNWGEAKRHLSDALLVLDKEEIDFNIVKGYLDIAGLHLAMKDTNAVDRIYRSTAAKVEKETDPLKKAEMIREIALQQSLIGNYDAGKKMFDQSIRIIASAAIDDKFKSCQAFRSTAELQNWCGDNEGALKTYSLAEREAHKIQNPQSREGSVKATFDMRNRVGTARPASCTFIVRIQVAAGRFNDAFELAKPLRQSQMKARVLEMIAAELSQLKD